KKRNEAANEKFEHAQEPTLPVNVADRQKNLDNEGDPHCGNHPTGECPRDCAIQAHGREHNQHDRGVAEGVDVQGVDQVVDVKDTAPDVENFQNKCEERDATKHHVREIAE